MATKTGHEPLKGFHTKDSFSEQQTLTELGLGIACLFKFFQTPKKHSP
jgi:hypothetical protein